MSSEKPRIPGPPVRVSSGELIELDEHRNGVFFAAIETTRMPMLLTDPRQEDNPIVFANRAFLAMTGYAYGDILGRNCRFLQGTGTDREVIKALREAIEQRREVSVELLNYRKDGTSFWNALFLSPVYNREGELVYFFASQLDVSRRRDVEEALSHVQKAEALAQLTGGISHNFNNLLQSMYGHLELMKLKSRNGSLARADIEIALESMLASVAKASSLTQHLLAFSRKQKLKGRVVNLNALALAMAPLMGKTLGNAISVRHELSADTPNCELDTTQFELSVLNLLANARDAMPNGGSVVVSTSVVDNTGPDARPLSGMPMGAYACLSISDSGTGIAPALLNRVMDPFFTTKEEGKGTGLGLSMVQGYAKQSGGTLALDSELGKGTTVKLYFPAVRGPAPQLVEHEAPRDNRGVESILVVDDIPEVADLARTMLEHLGYRVLVAHSAHAALELLEGLQAEALPHLLFTDVVMPGEMDGYGLARELQKRFAGLKVLLTTGFDRDLGHLANVAPDEFEIIRKPYRLSDLASRIRMTLDGQTPSA